MPISPPAFVKGTGSTNPSITPPRIRSARAQDWVQGAMQNARLQRLDGTLYFVGQMQGEYTFRCFDSATSHAEHNLIINWEKDSIRCTCWDAKGEYPCPHVGALYLKMQKMMQKPLPRELQYEHIYPWWSTLDAS